jgi:hypothetical protein
MWISFASAPRTLALRFCSLGVSKASPYRSEKRSHSEKKAPKMLRKVSHQPAETSDQFDCDLDVALLPRPMSVAPWWSW